MKKLAISIALFSLSLFGADFQAGLDAYNKGDFATALKEWQPLAEQGEPNSQYNMGLLYARGQGVQQDYAKAIEWYRKAGEQDVPAAEYNLGVMYANGQGVKADPQEAQKWFLKAAQKGVSEAVNGLATVYSEGEGAFQNYSEAEKWYRKAADQGVASAAFSLGVMYDVGQGVQQNYGEALKWYHKAADAGYASAMTNIAILYYNGQGVKRDLSEAYVWFARAQKLGEPRARQMISMAQDKLKPKDLKTAQAKVDSWQPATKAEAPVSTAEVLFKQPAQGAENTGVAERAAASPPSAAAVSKGMAEASAKSANGTATASAANPSAPNSATAAALSPAAKTPKQVSSAVWTGVERVVAIGDVHGDYESFAAALRSAGLINGNGDWTGGKTHLVQTGDILDRGPDSRAVMDLLMKLQKQAEAAGGAVHCLLGNHEAMNVYGDLRYVSPAEYIAFAPQNSQADRVASYDASNKQMTAAATPSLDQSQWERNRPAGAEERRAAFGPEGVYGKWLRGENAVIKIDRTLFVHAGLGPKYADWPIDRINNEVHAELTDFTRLHGGIVTDEQGPLWFANLAKGNEQQLQPLVDALLKNFD
ncbi:MAG TPA: metallophosphoesterase, partial [Bryobacteraceae bacterium]|nr:metallophosphoesterase [Bryobacteraceae bacterium]